MVHVLLIRVELDGDVISVVLVVAHCVSHQHYITNVIFLVIVHLHQLTDSLSTELQLKHNWILPFWNVLGVELMVKSHLSHDWVLSFWQIVSVVFMVELHHDWVLALWHVFGVIFMVKSCLNELVRLVFFFLSVHLIPLLVVLALLDFNVGCIHIVHPSSILVAHKNCRAWIKTIWDIVSINFMVMNHHQIRVDWKISDHIVSIIKVILELYEFMVLWKSSLLHVVALIVFMEETSIVAIWTKLCVMQCLVSVTNSWHVFWSINNVWVVCSEEVHWVSTLKSLGWIIKVKPSCSFLSWRVIPTCSLFIRLMTTTALQLMLHEAVRMFLMMVRGG